MDNHYIAEQLQARMKDNRSTVSTSVALRDYTTFKIGGPASVFAEPACLEDICAVVVYCHDNGLLLRVLGLGSDLLVADEGLDCVVMRIADNYSSMHVEGSMLKAQAGASNKDVAALAASSGLSGYEFACGIPGTVGGAAIMNAGAYDGEFKNACTSLECVTPDGDVVQIDREQADWSYRHSMMDDAGYVVVSVTLSLTPADSASVQAAMNDLNARREAKQPLDMPSAGSTFKRPEGYFAGKLIQDAGLRGYRIGGAQVSEKHTGFVVNAGGATAADVQALIAHIQDAVYEQEGVRMYPEVRYWSNEE